MSAQSAAHIATSNVDKPSIFELVASQSLDATFYPALKRIATVSVSFVYISLLHRTLNIAVFGIAQSGTLSVSTEEL